MMIQVEKVMGIGSGMQEKKRSEEIEGRRVRGGKEKKGNRRRREVVRSACLRACVSVE